MKLTDEVIATVEQKIRYWDGREEVKHLKLHEQRMTLKELCEYIDAFNPTADDGSISIFQVDIRYGETLLRINKTQAYTYNDEMAEFLLNMSLIGPAALCLEHYYISGKDKNVHRVQWRTKPSTLQELALNQMTEADRNKMLKTAHIRPRCEDITEWLINRIPYRRTLSQRFEDGLRSRGVIA